MDNYMRTSGSLTSRGFTGSALRKSSSSRTCFPVQRSLLPRAFLHTVRLRLFPKLLPESISLRTPSSVPLGLHHSSLLSLQSKVRIVRHEKALPAKEPATCRDNVIASNPRQLRKSYNEGRLTERPAEPTQVSLQLASYGIQTEEDLDLPPHIESGRTPVHARVFDWASLPARKHAKRIRRISVLRL